MLILKVLDVEEGKVLAPWRVTMPTSRAWSPSFAAVAQGAVKQVFGEAHGLPKVPPVVEEAVPVGRKPVYARASLYVGVATIAVGAALPTHRPRCGHAPNMIATLRRPTRTMRPALAMRSTPMNSSLVARQGIGVGAAVLGLGVLVWSIALEARMRGFLCGYNALRRLWRR